MTKLENIIYKGGDFLTENSEKIGAVACGVYGLAEPTSLLGAGIFFLGGAGAGCLAKKTYQKLFLDNPE